MIRYSRNVSNLQEKENKMDTFVHTQTFFNNIILKLCINTVEWFMISALLCIPRIYAKTKQ